MRTLTRPAEPLVRDASGTERSPAARQSQAWNRARLAAIVALLTGVVGLFIAIGADARWLAALGRIIVHRRSIPTGVPFASAPSAHWANTLVLAQIVFHGLESTLGDRGLVVANLIAIAAGLSLLAWDARAGGSRSTAVAGALALAVLGAFPSLAVARVQLFSLVLFPAIVALLRAEARRPSWRIWLTLPLLTLWSNLHGAALSGVAILFAYLALCRIRQERLRTVVVGLGALVALCITPAGLRTVDYYHGLLTNVAAQQGAGQWAPLGQSPFDWVLVASIAFLAIRLRHARPRLWELAVMIGLALLTIKAARDGVWLLFFLVGPASRVSRGTRDWNAFVPAAAAVALVLLVLDVTKAPHANGASHGLVERAVVVAQGQPILADGLPAEQLAFAGGRIWVGNPLDAFSGRAQTEYLDWISGATSGRTALSVRDVRFVLVTRGSGADRLTAANPDYSVIVSDPTAVLYRRTR